MAHYSFTSLGLERVRLAGLAPETVLSAIHSDKRVTRPVGDSGAAVFCLAETGQYLVVALEEVEGEAEDWDIVGARRMDRDETNVFIDIITRRKS